MKSQFFSHTKGHYGIEEPEYNLERKANGRLKRTKVQMEQKCNWHGNEKQRDSVIYHMLQSCGV